MKRTVLFLDQAAKRIEDEDDCSDAFYAYAPPAVGGARHGMSVDVAGELRVGGNSWILPTTDPTNGAPVRFRCARLVVEADGGFDAIGRGYSGAAQFIW